MQTHTVFAKFLRILYSCACHQRVHEFSDHGTTRDATRQYSDQCEHYIRCRVQWTWVFVYIMCMVPHRNTPHLNPTAHMNSQNVCTHIHAATVWWLEACGRPGHSTVQCAYTYSLSLSVCLLPGTWFPSGYRIPQLPSASAPSAKHEKLIIKSSPSFARGHQTHIL